MASMQNADDPGRDLPIASLETLKQRAVLVATIRHFFETAGFFEVETPLLSADIVIDAWLEPFVADWNPSPVEWRLRSEPRFLQTSPEFAMKRLIAAGADAIYQLGKVFRNGEFGRYHNPEFTMVEWYRRDDTLSSLMDFTEALVRKVLLTGRQILDSADGQAAEDIDRILATKRFRRLTYAQAFAERTDINVICCETSELPTIAERHKLVPPSSLESTDRDGWLNFLLAELIEPTLGRECPTFLTAYPASQAALAKLSADGETAERCELYIDGIELCNGYHELTDAGALRTRIREQTILREKQGLRPLPTTSRLLAAMDRGLPPCSGNAMGVDRLIMLALGKANLSEVIPFPFDIA